MDYVFESKWQELMKQLSEEFGDELDLQSVLFLIGVQELGQGYRKFKKDEKVDLMHVAICTLLEPYGYYEFMGKDDEGWPHFDRTSLLPNLGSGQQETLVKKAIMDYFKGED